MLLDIMGQFGLLSFGHSEMLSDNVGNGGAC